MWPRRYSPADLPSSTRAAPAKKRSSSSSGAISSCRVASIGSPVLRHSAAMISSARASTASAIRSRARCRSAGVLSRQTSKPASADSIARATSVAAETGADAYASPVHGSTTADVAPSAGSTGDPPTKLRRTGRSMLTEIGPPAAGL